ncbi:hypothetical protein D9757_002458 [Collybiopsis confluens]|uniref:Uncharacterized protein n=1 Tax=Collybiopsis confluens TaxID=2823264 RepID=A0A8H5HY55_9AGAR|nr:hypothetical protein D9757_002458 [Collybiopsis confluens]
MIRTRPAFECSCMGLKEFRDSPFDCLFGFLDRTIIMAFVYYCSGHGFGHATRVSAFASQLLRLPERDRPSVYIVSSAPQHVFADSVALGAQYRWADWVDPVIVQPLAYRVDRQKSVEVLKAFLKNKDAFLEIEREWLTAVTARCVLSDAAFLGCLAAKAAGIPSILITNFTFDSVYSYLATSFIDRQQSVHPDGTLALDPDIPVLNSLLDPLVSEIHTGYRSADLLLLLPGHIPIPSFSNQFSLPATKWVDTTDNRFYPEVTEHLMQLIERPEECSLHDYIPFPPNTALAQRSKSIARKILPMPLLVRPPSSSDGESPYSSAGRARILQSANVPPGLHDPEKIKVLVVSFGGQVLKWPGRKNHIEAQTRERIVSSKKKVSQRIGLGVDFKVDKKSQLPQLHISQPIEVTVRPLELQDHRDIDPQPVHSPRLATLSHIFIPGAPPAANPLGSPLVSSPRGVRDNAPGAILSPYLKSDKRIEKENESEYLSSAFSPVRSPLNPAVFYPLIDVLNVPHSPAAVMNASPKCGEAAGEPDPTSVDGFGADVEDMNLDDQIDVLNIPQLLPDSNWIAIVCGASQEQREDTSGLPDNFYLAPKDIYMPDLTAVADVLLGKLGYGTVAECIDAGTPMVYVSRPLFIEELGLRALLEKEGVGVEMSREEYERGRWVERVKEAWDKARVAKEWRRKVEEGYRKGGVPLEGASRERREAIQKMAKFVVDWADDCWRGCSSVD